MHARGVTDFSNMALHCGMSFGKQPSTPKFTREAVTRKTHFARESAWKSNRFLLSCCESSQVHEEGATLRVLGRAPPTPGPLDVLVW